MKASSVERDNAFLQRLITIPGTEIKTLAAVKKTIVPASPGKMIALHDTVFQFVAGSEVLVVKPGDDLIINYVGASGVPATGPVEADGFLDQAEAMLRLAKGVAISASTIAQLVNTPLVLDNTGVEFTGNASNDAWLLVWARYSLLTVMLL